MKKVNLLSKAEMKKVMGGLVETVCQTYASNNYTYPDTTTCYNCNIPEREDSTDVEWGIILDGILSQCERKNGPIPTVS